MTVCETTQKFDLHNNAKYNISQRKQFHIETKSCLWQATNTSRKRRYVVTPCNYKKHWMDDGVLDVNTEISTWCHLPSTVHTHDSQNVHDQGKYIQTVSHKIAEAQYTLPFPTSDMRHEPKLQNRTRVCVRGCVRECSRVRVCVHPTAHLSGGSSPLSVDTTEAPQNDDRQ